ncbi:ATP-binding cassette domain-containing protein [Halosimplex litoreum]|uniref:ATP-binding cassette domain-containing protein n=1 Tax=Halosimplex litoreum TaxID=1198301 RepID=A0A7T3FV07_9EURY|nr:ABC transporter ATP-binding protein [Halosimplex litoreum]QPV61240.1 ATP-binding cassette domain-containing protein [Halosimplex litoreum]
MSPDPATGQTATHDDPAAADRGDRLVSVRELRTYYDERTLLSRSPPVKAVDGVSLDLFEGETLGLVGESGCGKTTFGRTLVGLEDATSGTVEVEGRDVTDGDDADWRRRVGMVFQDPDESLNDRQTVGQIVREPLEAQGWPRLSVAVEGVPEATVSGSGPVVGGRVESERVESGGSATADVTSRAGESDAASVTGDPENGPDVAVDLAGGTHEVSVRERLPLTAEDVTVSVDRGERPTVSVRVGKSVAELRRDRAEELLARVGLGEEHVRRYPHQFSGGQRQRVGIARALALEPDFLVLDEPVSALDVSVQARIINLLEEIQDDLGLTYLFIAHDLSVVRHIADRVAVMYLGNVVELGSTESVFADPSHPYTLSLLSAIPGSGSPWDGERVTLRGTPPSPRDPPSGCPFATRCPAKIRSDEFDLPEDTWRALDELRVVFRTRARSEDSVAERARALVGLPVDAEAIDDAADELLSEVDLPPAARSVVDEAVDLATAGEDRAAADRLREAFGSRCDAEAPDAYATGDGERESRCLRSEDGSRGVAETVADRERGSGGGADDRSGGGEGD